MKNNLIFLIFIYALCFLSMYYFYNNGYLSYDFFESISKENSKLSVILFIMFFSAGMIFLLPVGLIFLLMSGIIWGPYYGAIISTISTTIAAGSSFLIMRYLSKSNIMVFIKNKINIEINLKITIENQLKYIILTTINPLLPQAILNYSFGLSKILFSQFIIYMAITSLVVNFLYTLLGASLKSIVIDGNITKGIIFFGIGITAITIILLTKDTKIFKI